MLQKPLSFAGIVVGLITVSAAVSSAVDLGGPGKFLDRPDDWFASPEAAEVARNILSHQSSLGGWPKNVDTSAAPYVGKPEDLAPTFDNRATTNELRFLARMIGAGPDDDRRYRTALVAGLDYILQAQYPTGGWPQSYPIRPRTYHRHITFNDDAMARLMQFLKEVVDSPRYDFLPDDKREAVQQSFDRGIECILKSQVVVDGRPTVWCAQHDEIDLQPRKGRWHELPSLSGAE
jgi:PelA/Pel-15E family pectate lyase